MPTNVKCVFTFRDDSGTGWQEVHYWLSPSGSPDLGARLTNMTDVVAPKRAAILSGDCVLIGVRASYPRPGATASLSKKFFIRGAEGESGVSPAVSLATEFVDTTKTARKITHLRGFWDSVEVNGEYHPEGDLTGTWGGRFSDWKTSLISSGYGWLSKNPAASGNGRVSTFALGVDGHVTYTLLDAMPASTWGTVVMVSMSRLNNSKSPANGPQLVAVAADGLSVRTIDQLAVGPSTTPGRFNFRGTGFLAYSEVYNISLGRRAQGRPFGQLPGRQPARARY